MLTWTCAPTMRATPVAASTTRPAAIRGASSRVEPFTARSRVGGSRSTTRERASFRVAASYERQRAPSEQSRSSPPPAYPPAPARGRPPPPPPPPRKLTWLDRLSSPVVILAAALALSVSNPGYVDRGREVILLNLYERQSAERMRGSGQYNQAVVRGDVLYKFNKFSGSITATTRGGLMVDGDGQIWVAVRYKNNPERVKQAWYIGDSRDLPPLPKNPSAKQVKQWNELARKRFGPAFEKLPDLQKVYDAPEPPVRKRDANRISKSLVDSNNRVAIPPIE